MYDQSERVLKGKGMFLAAVELDFTHPILNSEVSATIEMPQKFANLLSSQERRWNKYH